jgi:hypothetical protein
MRKVWCTLSAFAAIGCGGPSLSPGGKAGADGGGEGQHVVHFGDECTPSEDAGTSTPDCHGGVVDNENECHARFELVKCYVAELDGGAPKCLPASDPAVVDLIRDDTWLYGFVPQNVIREDAQRVLPDGCEASIACCASLPDKPMSGQRSCFDHIEAGTGCDRLDPTFDCSLQDSDAGSVVSGQHGLCCYLACGYEHTS